MTMTDQIESTAPSRGGGGKRRYRKITTDEKARILVLNREGVKSTVIGKLVDRDPAIIRRFLNEQGIGTPRLHWDAPQAMEMLDRGIEIEEVSRQVGKRPAAIRQYANRHGRSV
jgi:hypothetical protein